MKLLNVDALDTTLFQVVVEWSDEVQLDITFNVHIFHWYFSYIF
jgi:hypothetical protein